MWRAVQAAQRPQILDNQRQLYTTLLYTQQLTFDKTFGEHHLNVTAVYEQQGQKLMMKQPPETRTTIPSKH